MKTITHKLIKKSWLKFFFALALLLLGVLSFLLIYKIGNMSRASERVNHTNLVRLGLSQTLHKMKDVEAEQRGFLLTRDSAFLNHFTERGKDLYTHLGNLRHLVRDNPVQVKDVDTLQLLVANRMQLLFSVLAGYSDTSTAAPDLKLSILTGKQAMDAIEAQLAKMDSSEVHLLQKRTASSRQFTGSTPWNAGILVLTALLIILAAFIGLRRQLHILNFYLKQSRDAEQEAVKVNLLLQHAEEITGFGSWEYNYATGKATCSRNLFYLFGFEQGNAEADIKNVLPLVDPADQENMLQQIRQHRKEGRISTLFYFWATRTDGERRYFKTISRFGKNEQDEDVVTGTTQDITNTHLARQQAQQRAYFIERVVENNTDMIVAYNRNLEVTVWNKTAENLLGVSKDQILGKVITDVFQYLKEDEKLQLIKDALNGKETLRKEVTYQQNQRTGELSCIPLKDAQGNIEGVLVITHDVTSLKQALEQARASNRRFEQAEEAGNQGSFHWNPQTGELNYSNHLFRLGGYEPGSFTPSLEKFMELVHPEDRQAVVTQYRKNLEADAFHQPLHYRIIGKNGEIRYLKDSAVLDRNEKGERVLIGSVLDVTGETLLKQELEERTGLLESVIENSSNFISAIDADLRFMVWNKANENAFGLSKEEVLGKSLPEVFPELAQQQSFGFIQACLNGQASYNQEYTQSGITAEMSYIPLKDKEGKASGVLLVSHDITEIKQAAKNLEQANAELHVRNIALQEANTLNRLVTDMAPNAIYVLDLTSRSVVFVNQRGQEMFGCGEQEIAQWGSAFLEKVVHPEDLSLVYQNFERFETAADNELLELKYRIRNRNGEYRNQYVRETVFRRNEYGQAEQIIGMSVDITEILRAKEELRNKNRELQHANEELSSFNFIASHDLQEPLRKIQTFASYLQGSETGLSEDGKNTLQRMQKAAGRMRNLITDLLAFSKTSLVHEEWEQVDLTEVLQEASFTLKAAMDEKGASVVADKLPAVQGVPFQLQQLFENLIGNSVKYSRPGVAPVITIAVREVTGAQANRDGLSAERTYHCLQFSDNGIGFDPLYTDKIFELFQRLHNKSQYPGTGLGLAICKKILQNHQGQIRAIGKPGEGAVFEVYLPAVPVLQPA